MYKDQLQVWTREIDSYVTIETQLQLLELLLFKDLYFCVELLSRFFLVTVSTLSEVFC